MHGSLSLNGTWGLLWAEGSMVMPSSYYTGRECEARTVLPAAVPAPIHQVLRDNGLLEDPNLGLNSLQARWVEDQYWTYRREFSAPAEAVEGPAWLCFDRLELMATVWLNGEQIGTHANAHRPARFCVTGKLRDEGNLLVVQVTTGMQEAGDRPVSGYMGGETDRLTRRPWLRKPQYQGGWDWNPRLVNVGILGDVRLEWCGGPRLDQVTVFALPSEDLSSAVFWARVTVENCGEEVVAGTLRLRLAETGEEVAVAVSLPPGESRPEVGLERAAPRLWWPVGQGEAYLYTVEVSLEAGGETQRTTRRTGVRRVEMDQSPHPVTGRYCIIKINNRPVFVKGGNWSPADLMYSRVEPERYRRLVELAVEANFNFLRVWGGGIYEAPLLELCDELGVLVWHDLLFACAQYPGDDPEWAAEACREVTWGVRELAHHPSLVVWCGNNEIEWGDWSWGYDGRTPAHPHYALFHRDLPRIVRAEAPAVLQWISSPWSPDYLHPNDPTAGDQHPWGVSIGTAGGADWWAYRGYVDRLPNEGGVLGASSLGTLRQFLPEGEQRLFSLSWSHHDNPIAVCDVPEGALGKAYKTVLLWTGRDPREMCLDDYAFLSGLLQGEGLAEYAANYRRRMFSSASAAFWSYNDSWPVSNGWSIVDYYLRRKLAYHPVRRAYLPVTVVVAEEEGRVGVYGVNDTSRDWEGELRYGIFSLAGGWPREENTAVTLPANASTLLAEFPRSEWEALGTRRTGAGAVLSQDGRRVAQHRLLLERFHQLELAPPRVEVTVAAGTATFRAEGFVWGVCLEVEGDAELGDNCFDLLPGIPYEMPWQGEQSPVVVRTGSGAVLGV